MNTALANPEVVSTPEGELLLDVASQIINEYGLQDDYSPQELIDEDDPSGLRELVMEAARQRSEREAAERKAAKLARLEAARRKLEQDLGLVQEPEPEVTPVQESPPVVRPTEDRAVVVSRPTSSASKSAEQYLRRKYLKLPDVCFISAFAVENSMASRGVLIAEEKRLKNELIQLEAMSDFRQDEVFKLRGELHGVLDQLAEYLDSDLHTDFHDRKNFASTATFKAIETALRRDDRTEKFFRTFVAKETDAPSDETKARSATSTSGGRAASDARKRKQADEDRAFRNAAKGSSNGGGGKNNSGKKKK